MRTVCCLCHRAKVNNGWVSDIVLDSKKLSHGYCPDCFKKTIQEIRDNAAGSHVHGQQAKSKQV